MLSDIEIINNLFENGIDFVEKLIDTTNSNNPNNSNNIVVKNYIHSYFTEDIYENASIELTNRVCSKNFKVWDILIDELSNDEILKFLSLFVNYKYENFKDKIFVMNHIMLNKKVQDSLCTNKLCDFNNNDDILNKSFLGKLFSDINNYESFKDNNWINNIKLLCSMFLKMFKNKDLCPYVIKWIANIFNLNIGVLNGNDDNNNYNSIENELFMMNVLLLLMFFWNDGVFKNNILNKDKLKIVKSSYIKSMNCPIKWYDKDNNNNYNDGNNYNFNFLTKLFFLILNGIRVYYIPAIKKLKDSKKLIESDSEIQNLVNSASESGPFASLMGGLLNTMLNQIYESKNISKKYVDIFNDVLNNDIIISMFLNFSDHFYEWYIINSENDNNNNFDLIVDDTLDDLGYLKNKYVKKYKKIDIDKKIIELFKKISSNDKYTKNISIISFYYNLLLKFNKYNIINDKEMFETTFDFIILVNNLNNNERISFLKKINGYKFINKFKDSSIEIDKFIKLDDNRSIKFVNCIVKDLNFITSNVDPLIKEFFENYNYSNNTISKKDIDTIDSFLKMYFLILEIFNSLTNSNIFKKIANKKEIVSTLGVSLNCIHTHIYKYFHFNYDNFDEILTNSNTTFMKSFVNEISRTYFNFQDNDTFVENIIGYVNNFDINKYIEMEMYINNNITQSNDMKIFIDCVKDKYNKLTTVEEIDYPDEFMDPLMCVKIETPVMLPEVNDQFFEKSIIDKCLLQDEKNPYTRKKLTLSEFENYNKQEHIVNAIDEFKNKMTLWEKENLSK